MQIKNLSAWKRGLLIWLAIVLLPVLLYYSMYVIGLIGLMAYLSYYVPMTWLGEPYFKLSTDIGWYFPSLYGTLATAAAYSLVFGAWQLLLWRAKRRASAANHSLQARRP